MNNGTASIGLYVEFQAAVLRQLPRPGEFPEGVLDGWNRDQASLKRVLAEALLPPVSSPRLKVWKTIKLGTGLFTAYDFREVLTAEGFRIGDWANDTMSQPDFSKSMEDVDPDEEFDLVVITTKELLGEDRNGTTDEVFAGAKRLGLEECPVWMGPKLRLEYMNQPHGGLIFTGIKPIRDSDGCLSVFCVVHNDSGLWLCSDYADPDRIWTASAHWVFCRSRKCQKQNLDS